jgi:MurNAc alpha-1-phosphate uridylyltransferase
MVLAAGLGERMRPLTLKTPKPLIEVAGKALIARGIERLRLAGVRRAVINVHYLASQIEAWAATQTGIDIVISDERHAILDTGGGIALALPHLGEDPFFVINSDSFWLEQGCPALERLRSAWEDGAMDCLLLLCPPARTVGYDGSGDFRRSPAGQLSRKDAGTGEALTYIGAYLVAPRLFAGAPSGKFSMNLLWDRAIAAGRLYGIVHEGLWIHVGTPAAVALAERTLAGHPE